MTFTIHEKIYPAEFAAILKTAGMAAEIEMIQPDFILSFAEIGISYKELGKDATIFSSRHAQQHNHGADFELNMVFLFYINS